MSMPGGRLLLQTASYFFSILLKQLLGIDGCRNELGGKRQLMDWMLCSREGETAGANLFEEN